MATQRLISAHLRRSQFSLLRSLQPLSVFNATSSPLPPSNPPPSPSTSSFNHSSCFLFTTSFRCCSSRSSESGFTHDLNSVTESELRRLGFTDGAQIADAAAGDLLEDYVLPIRAVVSLLDGYHDLTGFPWWIIIASSTVALRIALFPWLILSLQKLSQIALVFPKLPPAFPPPFSGRSFADQFSRFRRKREALGCPSFSWFLASYTVQLPCFILLMSSIRSMSLDHHPGFDTGGILWFQNLTELPSGVLGSILPVLVAGLHFCNVQISFRSSSLGNGTGLFDLLINYYRKYLKLLTLPFLFIGFCIPQASIRILLLMFICCIAFGAENIWILVLPFYYIEMTQSNTLET